MLQGTVGHAAPRTRVVWLLWAAVFAGFVFFFTRPARLFDADSYLHLALARDFVARALAGQLDWARFSTLAQSYGDKELLFHLLLVPFAHSTDAELGGKLALAGLCFSLAWSLWWLGAQALGARGWVVPLLVFGSGSFVLRAIRLRPELLALLLLLWVVWALAQRRPWLAGVLACAFTLSHTAFHSLLGLAVAFFAWVRFRDRRWEWQLLAAVFAGVASGVLLHPQFPRNLSVFWTQNVELFRMRAALPTAQEFGAHSIVDIAALDGLFWLGLVLVFLSRTRAVPGSENVQRMAAFCAIAALAFGALFTQMGRFATLFIPFVALSCAFALRARGFELGARVKLPAGRSLSSLPTIAAVAALSCGVAGLTALLNWKVAGSFDASLRAEQKQLARLLPPGARVAASWDDAETYVFHAPHARYLNLYDPVFMAARDPERHGQWLSVLSGAASDPADVVKRDLDSDYLAFSVAGREALLHQLAAEPRAKLLHRGRHALYRIE